MKVHLSILFLAGTLITTDSLATPARLPGIDRSQFIDRSMDEDDIMRIWMLYIGQGDAILVQFPTDGTNPIELLVDGGKSGAKLRQHFRDLYPNATQNSPVTIEHVTLTHHDLDHMQGLTGLMKDNRFNLNRIYHNGLATWQMPTNLPSDARIIRDDQRFLGRLEDSGDDFTSEFRITDLASIQSGVSGDQFQGKFETYASEIAAQSVAAERVLRGDTIDLGGNLSADIELEVRWPEDPPQAYDGTSWSHTINGNSVVLKLTYNDFSILLTGDMNSHSEEEMFHVLESSNQEDEIAVDVLKVPHHGSADNDEAYLRATGAIVSIGSMGNQGFTQWHHPSETVVSWTGGFRRSYHTHARELRSFDGRTDSMVESNHILIETDGEWFRLVEFTDLDDAIPTVRQTATGNGTRWIRAE